MSIFVLLLCSFALISFTGSIVLVCSYTRLTQDLGLNEACSGFHHIGHNDLFTLIWAWIIPKLVLILLLSSSPVLVLCFVLTLYSGAWLVVPTYIGYVLGAEILQGLEIAGGLPYNKDQ